VYRAKSSANTQQLWRGLAFLDELFIWTRTDPKNIASRLVDEVAIAREVVFDFLV
jgi:hypothetical protein